MQSLSEILIDAARYRWIRENMAAHAWQFVQHPNWPEVTPAFVDQFIDKALEND